LEDKLMTCMTSLLRTEEDRDANFHGFVMRESLKF